MLSKKSRSFKLLAYVQIKSWFYRHFKYSKCPKLQGLETITEFAQKTIMRFAKEHSVFLKPRIWESKFKEKSRWCKDFRFPNSHILYSI